jgi:uncharacterized protein (TIGR03435 family)
MRSLIATLVLLTGSAAFGQSPTFEVASIKPAAPQAEGRIMVRMGGDAGRVDYVNVSLRDLIRQAFDIKDYQLNAPDWLNNARFDVQAKMPPDTTKEAKALMLQALLAERFGLKVHKESKDLPIYSLVVGKNGPKLKKAENLPPDAAGTPPPPGAGPGRPAAGGSVGGTFRGPGGPGGPGVPGGRGPGGPPPPGMIRMMMDGPGRFHLTGSGMSLAQLADMLSRQVGKPVIDNTGITGFYDVDLEFKPEEGMGGMRGLPMPMPRGDGGEGGRGPAPDAVEAPSIFTAVQDQLGLKLEGKKGPVETVVVDHVEKAPTEN